MPFDRIINYMETRVQRREQNLKMTEFFGLISALVNFRNWKNIGAGETWQTGISSNQNIAGRQHRKRSLHALCFPRSTGKYCNVMGCRAISHVVILPPQWPWSWSRAHPHPDWTLHVPTLIHSRWEVVWQFSTFLLDGILLLNWIGAIWQVAQQDGVSC